MDTDFRRQPLVERRRIRHLSACDLGAGGRHQLVTILADKGRFDAVLADSDGGDGEQTGTNWIKLRRHQRKSISEQTSFSA